MQLFYDREIKKGIVSKPAMAKGLIKKSRSWIGTLKIFCFLKAENYFFLGAAFLAAFLGAAFLAAAFFGAAFFAAFFFVAIFLKFNWLVNNT